MPSVAVLAADGFETIECLTMVDVMRRGGENGNAGHEGSFHRAAYN